MGWREGGTGRTPEDGAAGGLLEQEQEAAHRPANRRPRSNSPSL